MYFSFLMMSKAHFMPREMIQGQYVATIRATRIQDARERPVPLIWSQFSCYIIISSVQPRQGRCEAKMNAECLSS